MTAPRVIVYIAPADEEVPPGARCMARVLHSDGSFDRRVFQGADRRKTRAAAQAWLDSEASAHRRFAGSEVVMWENDEGGPWSGETPRARWERMRRWIVAHLKGDAPNTLAGASPP